MCACRPCYLLFMPGGAGGGRYRAVPDRYVALPGVAVPRPVGRAADPGRRGVLLLQLARPTQVRRLLPGPGRCHRVAAAPRRAGSGSRDADPALADLEADVEALLVRAAPTGDPACYIVPIDACYELVGHLRLLWKGFDGGQEARTRRWTSSSPACSTGPSPRPLGPAHERPRTSRSLGAEPDRYAAAPTLLFRLRVTESRRAADPRPRPARARSASSPSGAGTRPAEEERLLALFGETPQWGDSLRPFLWTHAIDHGRRASPGPTEVDLPVPCTYDFEVARPSTSTRSATARSR